MWAAARLRGRDAEIEWLRGAAGGPGVIAVHGPAGVGKSALVAAALAELEPIVVVPGRTDRGPRLAQRLLAALGADPGRRNPMDVVLERLREAPSRIVFDGCEPPPHAVVAFAAQLAAAGATVVVVARELLGGEGRLAVRPFVVPAISALRGAPVMDVWLGFAERIRPGYAVSDAELPTLHAILSRLDGLPLAMSLVAPRLAALDHAAILRELEDGAESTGPLAAVKRALAASHRTLAKRDRDVLALAATFPSTFDAARLHELRRVRRSDLHDALQRLVERSWLVAEEPAGSLRMLGVVRDFVRARERARIGELDRGFAQTQAATAGRLADAAERSFAVEEIRSRADDLLRAAELGVRLREAETAVPPSPRSGTWFSSGPHRLRSPNAPRPRSRSHGGGRTAPACYG